MNILFRKINNYYLSFRPGGRNSIFFVSGWILGLYFGQRDRKKDIDSSYITMYTYNIKESDSEDFESSWNDSAKVAQKVNGYEFTKMYKCLDFITYPYNYIQIRVWNTIDDEKVYYSEKILNIVGLRNIQNSKKYNLIKVVDDSEKRLLMK
eukprot:GHVL01039271.1.p1 GENE.GHVL01039271.1~~GHVL01039271.1.p1  ORF type:complete len:151 (-),score=35.72 GHVL01039271.1:80-532(-)